MAATIADVVARTAADFRPSSVVRIGAEVEWHVVDLVDRTANVAAVTVAEVAAGPLPAGGRTTIEPGGQLELVTRPESGPEALLAAIDRDARVLVERFAAAGLGLVAAGVDHVRPPHRSLEHPRYAAMERHFARLSPAGLTMMSRTASLQLNIDAGPDPAATWGVADRLGPLLAAAFANSPGPDRRRASQRQQIWAATDPTRTRPVGPHPDDWTRYALGARMMLRHDDHGAVVAADSSETLADAIAAGSGPTEAELDLHLTTLFPPIRPRGFLELRMIDALPPVGRRAAIETVWACLAEPRTLAVPDSGAAGWRFVTEHGTDHPEVAAACVDLLERVGTPATLLWRDRLLGPPPSADEVFTVETGASTLPP